VLPTCRVALSGTVFSPSLPKTANELEIVTPPC